MITHKHTGWTGKTCPSCNGSGERNDPACGDGSTCQQPVFCRCPFNCPDCSGTGDEHGEVTAEQCDDSDCPEKS